MSIPVTKRSAACRTAAEREVVIDQLADLDELTTYIKRRNARLGCLKDHLRVEFSNGTICDTRISYVNVSSWIDHIVRKHPRRLAKVDVVNFRCVVLDETQYWTEEIVRRAGGQIWATYLFDASRHIHCCEITPSYWLSHLYSTPLMDDEDGSLSEIIREAELEAQTFGNYYHVASIERLPSRHFIKDFGLQFTDESGNDEPKPTEIEQSHSEYLLGNCGAYAFPLDA